MQIALCYADAFNITLKIPQNRIQCEFYISHIT